MLPRSCCSCCKDDNEMAPHERLEEDGYSFGCADFCGTSSRMSEGRQSQVVLLDDRRLDILIKPKLYAGELLDMVASHFSLKEKEYFGLAYLDDTGHYSWLQLDRRILEHEFPKRPAHTTLLLYFRIKYFVESITHLRDRATVEAFYLQTQMLVYNGILEVSTDKVFQLAALVLQATHGDYTNEDTTRERLKKLTVIPATALVDHPSLHLCEEKILEHYQHCQGQSRGTAIVNYMRKAESLPTYGVHYYEVKDKAGLPWWLGISYKGICQYDPTDRKVPRKLFLWKQLENLYFRDRKFSIEISDPKRVTASRKTFGSGKISVCVWFASSPTLTKCIWSMACSQHQFYLDRKHNKFIFSPTRNLCDIADELSHNSYSTETSSLGRSVSSLSLPALKLDSDSCDEMLDSGEMFVALKARREALEEVLRKKCDELKNICVREGELTGTLPPEMPLSPGEQIPVIHRKSGADIQDKWLWRKKTKDEEEFANLELEYTIQNKIVIASHKLLNDTSLKKSIRRQRKLLHQKAVSKLKEIELRLIKFKKDHLISSQIYLSNLKNVIQTSSAKAKDLSITFMPTENKKEEFKNSLGRMTSSKSSPVPLPSHLSNSVPSSPARSHKQPSIDPASELPDPSTQPAGYTPSSVYQTRTSYRSQQYPTFSMRSPTSCSSASSQDGMTGFGDRDSALIALTAPYRNKFESTLDLDGSNLYSVPTQRTSQAFDTQDDSLTSMPTNTQDLGLVSRHNSLDRNRRRSLQKYQAYLESLKDTSRPNSALSSHDNSYDNPAMCTYEDERSSASFHHPHHYNHHRYHGSLSPTQPSRDSGNMFQKNLQLCATGAILVGNQSNPLVSPKSVKHWTEFSATDSKSRTIISPCDPSNLGWVTSKVHNSGSTTLSSHLNSMSETRTKQNKVLTSTSMGTLKTSHPGELGAKIHTWSSSKVPSSTSMGSIKDHSRQNLNIHVVSSGHFQPYWEETKPYETADFYKYSTRHRKQHQEASHNLHSKLMAWKASQSQQFASGSSSTSLSPMMERSRASSSSRRAGSIDGVEKPPSKNDMEGSSSTMDRIPSSSRMCSKTPEDDAENAPNWYTTQEKGKKVTLV